MFISESQLYTKKYQLFANPAISDYIKKAFTKFKISVSAASPERDSAGI